MLLPPVLKLWLPLRFVVPWDAEEDEVEDPPPTTHEGFVVVGLMDGIVFPNANGLIGFPSSRDLLLRSLLDITFIIIKRVLNCSSYKLKNKIMAVKI